MNDVKRRWVQGVGSCAFGLLVSVVAVFGAQAGAGPDAAEVRNAMQGIFSGIKTVLPLSVSDQQFRDPANRPKVRVALESIAGNASLLGTHVAQERGRGFRFLGGSLEESARETLRAYEMGRYDVAEYNLHRMTEYCVACHSRLPSDADSPLAQDFIGTTDLTIMPLQERAALEVATRRFDDALTTYEKLLRSPNEHPAALLGPITDYLTVSIRVKGDAERPISTLETFSARPDLWEYIKLDVEHWLRDLRAVTSNGKEPANLESARSRIDQARRSIQFPADRRALVNYVIASSQLHQFLDPPPDDARAAAEAYYLLGLTETRIGRNYWVSQANFYLETAIRTAPQEPFAREAYALLEEETVFGYTGSGGTHIPPDVQERLDELKALVEGRSEAYGGARGT